MPQVIAPRWQMREARWNILRERMMALSIWLASAAAYAQQAPPGAAPPASAPPAAAEGAGYSQYIPVAIWVVVFIALIPVAVWAYRRWKDNEPVPRYLGGKDIEPSIYEQVASELQGIRLRIRGGDARTYLPKIERLVHIFVDRRGLEGAREMNNESMIQALDSELFDAEQIEVIKRVLERCEATAVSRRGKPDLGFDPIEMIGEFQDLVQQLEDHTSA